MRRPLRAAIVTVVLAAAACGGSDSAGTLPEVDVEPLTGGDPISLADIEGPAVVNLWATWCAPCRKEIPDFEAVHQAHGDEIRFVGINVGEDAGPAADFVAELGATYDQYLDRSSLVATELEASAMPTTVVIDADGEIVERHLGAMDQDELEAAIDEAIGR